MKLHQENRADLRKDIEEDAGRRWYRRMFSAPVDSEKLPLGMKIFGVLCVIAAAYGAYQVISDIVSTVMAFTDGRMNDLGISTTVVTFLYLILLFLISVSFAIFGIRLFRNQRRFAALVIYAMYILILGVAICTLMLSGVNWRFFAFIALLCLLIAFQVYLDPSLRQERQLQRILRDNELRYEQEDGTLGRDETGKGYIQLNFFNLFWIFVVCSIIGDAMETAFHYLVVDPGHMQDRAGLLFGPFSPIYGCGAVLMTLFLNRFYKSNVILIFFFSAIIGGLFEAFVSYFMQYTFGAVAWDYTGQFLSLFGGRTCGLAMAAWGLLGVIWIKLLLPFLLWLVNRIPWNWRYGVTTVAAVLIAVDCVMSLQALDCWYERLSHKPIDTPIQQFYDKNFDNAFMEHRFQSMTINPDTAVRAGK